MSEHRHVLTATEARQGQTLHVVRWVLIGGLALAIPALATAWYILAS